MRKRCVEEAAPARDGGNGRILTLRRASGEASLMNDGGPTYLKQKPVLTMRKFLSRMIRPVVGGGGPTYLKQNLFHPRMIRPVVGGGGRTYLKQKKKELSTKGH